MKSTIYLATLFATNGLGAAIEKRQCNDGGFDIVNFYASCIPHSVMCSYEFNVTTSADAEPVACSAFIHGPDYLPAVELNGCTDPTVSWSFAIGDNYTLTVKTASTPGQNLTATHIITGDEVILENHGSVSDQRYTGAQNFTITDLKTVAA